MQSQHSKISIITISTIKRYYLILHLLRKDSYDGHKNKTTNFTILQSWKEITSLCLENNASFTFVLHKKNIRYKYNVVYNNYRNPSLGLVTKAYKGVGQEGRWKVTSHVPSNVGECVGMNPHTPK